jgi:hypothetical protein
MAQNLIAGRKASNPRRRRPGAGYVARATRTQVGSELPTRAVLTGALVERAKGGDLGAARLVLERLVGSEEVQRWQGEGEVRQRTNSRISWGREIGMTSETSVTDFVTRRARI